MFISFLAASAVVPADITFWCTPTSVYDGDGPIWCADPKDVTFASIYLRSGLSRHDRVRKSLELILSGDLLATALGRVRRAALTQSQAGR